MAEKLTYMEPGEYDEQLEAAIEEANEDGDRAMRMFGYFLFAAIIICAIVLGFVLGTLAN